MVLKKGYGGCSFWFNHTGDYNYLEGQTVTLSATPIRGLSFKGWYSDNEYVKLLSSEFIYTFTMADSDVDIYAKFMSEEEWKIAHGIIPCIRGDNTKLTYGLYPQKHVNNPLLIECLNELDDSYILIDDSKRNILDWRNKGGREIIFSPEFLPEFPRILR